ncbi:hypothetical protein L7F22_008002 [Adiantum nelumboides]|nr:hypothetical protein [Adiantum nelumboides]
MFLRSGRQINNQNQGQTDLDSNISTEASVNQKLNLPLKTIVEDSFSDSSSELSYFEMASSSTKVNFDLGPSNKGESLDRNPEQQLLFLKFQFVIELEAKIYKDGMERYCVKIENRRGELRDLVPVIYSGDRYFDDQGFMYIVVLNPSIVDKWRMMGTKEKVDVEPEEAPPALDKPNLKLRRINEMARVNTDNIFLGLYKYDGGEHATYYRYEEPLLKELTDEKKLYVFIYGEDVRTELIMTDKFLVCFTVLFSGSGLLFRFRFVSGSKSANLVHWLVSGQDWLVSVYWLVSDPGLVSLWSSSVVSFRTGLVSFLVLVLDCFLVLVLDWLVLQLDWLLVSFLVLVLDCFLVLVLDWLVLQLDWLLVLVLDWLLVSFLVLVLDSAVQVSLWNPDNKGKTTLNKVGVLPSASSGSETQPLVQVNVVTRAQAKELEKEKPVEENARVSVPTENGSLSVRIQRKSWKAKRERMKARRAESQTTIQEELQKVKQQLQHELESKKIEQNNQLRKAPSRGLVLVDKVLEPLDALLKQWEARLNNHQTLEQRWLTYPYPEIETKRLEMCKDLIRAAQALMELNVVRAPEREVLIQKHLEKQGVKESKPLTRPKPDTNLSLDQRVVPNTTDEAMTMEVMPVPKVKEPWPQSLWETIKNKKDGSATLQSAPILEVVFNNEFYPSDFYMEMLERKFPWIVNHHP